MEYPGVSAILAAAGLGPDFSGARPADLEMGRLRGQAFDQIAEALHYGYDYEVTPEVAPYVESYLSFLKDSGHEPLVSQFEVRSERWQFRGHPDRLGWLQQHRAILDWKTGDAFQQWPTARQLAAYRLAWNEQHPTETVNLVVAVQFRSDATYRLHEYAQEEVAVATSDFLAALTVHWAKERRR